MDSKKVAIIGAGIGGITTGIYLAQQGFDVSIFEKNGFAGGRCGNFTKDGHRFDIGATLMMMPYVFEETFAAMGKKLEKELDLIRLDPIYLLKFAKNQEMFFTSDLMKMQEQMEKLEPGSFIRFLKFMSQSYHAYKLAMKHIIEKNYFSPFDFFNLKNIFILLKVKALKDHYKYTKKFFKNEFLRASFTFQNIYVGQNPYNASAIFSMMPFLEMAEGVFYPKGGMYAIIEKLMEIAREKGVKIHLNSPVKRIITNNKKVSGLELENDTIKADIVVSNADLPYTYTRLLPETRYTKKIKNMQYTCSAIVYHWAMDKSFTGLEQHTIFASKNYKENIEALFKKSELTDDISFYVHSPVKNDPSAAPENKDSITVIVPIQNINLIKTGDEKITTRVKKMIFARLEKEGLSRFENHIIFERIYTQHSWKNIYNLTHGSIFGSLSHTILQMGYFRPHNQHKKFRNLFFVGGSTHPGNGVPMALISAKLSFQKVMYYFKKEKNEIC